MARSSTQRLGTRRRKQLPDEEVRRLLAPTSTTAERLQGLAALGLPPVELARCLGVSPSTLRNWTTEQAEPRANASITLDDLRAVALTLLVGGLEPKRVVRWLTSRQAGELGARPLDVLPERPTHVLTAAEAQVLQMA